MSAPLLYEQNEHVVILTLNRPESRNPISEPDTVDAFEQACQHIQYDDSVRAVIITGNGKAFSAGGNIKDMHELAARITFNPPAVVRMSKRLIREALHTRVETLLELSAAMQPLAHHTEDHNEAVSAMLEKRSPQFTGQ